MDRDNKGTSICKLLNNYVVIDIETTGYDSRFDDIIELSAISVREGEITDAFQQLVNPGYMIDEFIESHTGITNGMLVSAPPISQVIGNFFDFVGNSIVVAHNANFDINFLYDNGVTFNLAFSNDFIDTMRMSRRLFKEHQHHRLIDLITRFGIGNTVDHRGLSDATNAMKCYEYMKQYILDNQIDIDALYARKRSYGSGWSHYSVKAKDVITTNTEFDETHPLYGKTCVITGTLSKVNRSNAMQLIVDIGGINGDKVTKATDYLIVGSTEYNHILKGAKSSKHKRAEQLILKGQDLTILSEDAFYDLVNDE